MFYRRKVILAILEVFGNEIEKVRLQKLLFLLSKVQSKPAYDFVPYKFGCYSFSASADIATMIKKGILVDTDNGLKKDDPTIYFKSLIKKDQLNIEELKKFYGNLSVTGLMKHTYINFPFWATKSLRAKEILSSEQFDNVSKAIPSSSEIILFTIGYEGISLEEYLLKLLKNDIKVLVDVRRNPLSMKFGFSKSLLKKYCNALDLEYVHFPEVGIQSDERQELHTQADYNALFLRYRTNNIPTTIEIQDKILDLLKTHSRIALTCFEASHCQCHRSDLATAIIARSDNKFELKHI